MKEISKDIINNKGEVYNVHLRIDEKGKLLPVPKGFSCTCRFGSLDFYTKKNLNITKTICRHILQTLAEENIDLPDRFKTPRNIKLMEKLK